MKSFTARWNRRYLAKWERELKAWADRPVDYLELGIYEGYTICRLMGSILSHPWSTATGIDPWANEYITGKDVTAPHRTGAEIEARARANLRKYGDRVHIIKGESAAVLGAMLEVNKTPRFDLVFVDGLHTPRACMVDSCLCWELLRPGGVMIWDNAKQPRMAIAIKAFRRYVAGKHRMLWTSTTYKRRPMQMAVQKIQ